VDSPQIFRDHLTGVLAQGSFQANFHDECSRAVANDESLSIIVLDLDHFKSVNDAFGHARGDEILCEFTRRIQTVVRDLDFIFRYGGDEFVILLPRTSREQAIAVGKRLLQATSETPFQGNPTLSITVSSGLASCPHDGKEADVLFERADKRLLEAKKKGRARIISEDFETDPSLPFHEVSRLVERDGAIEEFLDFLNSLSENKCGILNVRGKQGSGRTRFLNEIVKIGALRGCDILQLRGDRARKHDSYGVLRSALLDWNINLEAATREDFQESICNRLQKSRKSCLLVAIDNVRLVDRASLEFVQYHLHHSQQIEFGVVLNEEEGAPFHSLSSELCVQKTIEIKPLSLVGMRVWLRSLLNWEPDQPFLDWLYRETVGFPALVEKALKYLVQQNILCQDKKEGWLFSKTINDTCLVNCLDFNVTPPPHNLPLKLTGFIGRHTEIEDVSRLIDENNMVTLIGAGGIGKTRLAIQVALEKIDLFGDGIYFISLAPVTSGEFLLSTIAETIYCPLHSEADSLQSIIDFLGNKQMLLLFDNFEHLQQGTSSLVQILEQCPDVQMMITSREHLCVHGECVFEVTGMNLPPEQDFEHPEKFSATQLFIQSARSTSPQFSVTPESGVEISEICHLLEGVPLAIELAASWVRVLSCRRIIEEIKNSLDFLSSEQEHVPVRHQSLRAVFNHSWQLLTSAEQTILRQLSVFIGSYSFEAIQFVTDATLMEVKRLTEKSMLHSLTPDRFFILEVLRQYASEKLNADPRESERVLSRHSQFYANFVQTQKADYEAGDISGLSSTITPEIENIREGFKNAAKRADNDTLILYLEGLARYYNESGLFQQGEQLFSIVSDYLDPRGYQDQENSLLSTLAKLLSWRGVLTYNLSLQDESESLWTRSLALHQKLGEQKGIAMALNALGVLMNRRGGNNQAISYYKQSLEILKSLSDQKDLATTLNNLANTLCEQGDIVGAQALHSECLALERKAGNKRGIAYSLTNLGLTLDDQGLIQESIDLIQESFAIFKEIGDQAGIGNTLSHLAHIEEFMGNFEKAREMLEQSMEIRRDINDQWGQAYAFFNLGKLANALGETDDAEKLLNQSQVIFKAIGYSAGQAATLNALGEVFLRRDQIDQAGSLFDKALGIYKQLGNKIGCTGCTINLGSTALQRKNYLLSCELLQQALRATIDMKMVPATLETMIEMARWLDANSKPEDALTILYYVKQQPAYSAIMEIGAKQLRAKIEEQLEPSLCSELQTKVLNMTMDQVANFLFIMKN